MVLYERSGDDIDRGLVGYWKLDDLRVSTSTAIDRANFNDGTITGAVNTDGINGLSPDAMLFNGTNEFIDVGNPTSLQTGNKPFTYACWIKTTDTNGYIIAKRDSSTDGAFSMWVDFTGDLEMFVANNLHSGGIKNINDDEWHHVAIAYNVTYVKFYIDGVFQAINTSIDATGFSDSKDVHIANRDGGEGYLDGRLSNLRFYNRELNSSEISKLHRLRK